MKRPGLLGSPNQFPRRVNSIGHCRLCGNGAVWHVIRPTNVVFPGGYRENGRKNARCGPLAIFKTPDASLRSKEGYEQKQQNPQCHWNQWACGCDAFLFSCAVHSAAILEAANKEERERRLRPMTLALVAARASALTLAFVAASAPSGPDGSPNGPVLTVGC